MSCPSTSTDIEKCRLGKPWPSHNSSNFTKLEVAKKMGETVDDNREFVVAHDVAPERKKERLIRNDKKPYVLRFLELNFNVKVPTDEKSDDSGRKRKESSPTRTAPRRKRSRENLS